MVAHPDIAGARAAPVTRETAAARLPWPVALYLFCVLIPVGVDVGPLALTSLRLFLLVVTVPLMARILAGRCGPVLATDVLFLAHMAWAALALAANNPDRVVEQAGSVGLEFLGGYAVGRSFVRTPEAFVALCRALALVVCASLPFAVHEMATGRPILVEALGALPGLETVAVNDQAPRLGLERVQFTFAHPIHYGLFCAVALSLAHVGLRGVVSDARRFAQSAAIAFCGFTPLSSAALLAIALQMGLIGWQTLLSRLAWRWWLLATLAALAYVAVDLLSNRTPVQVLLSYATFSPHTGYWRLLILEHGMMNVLANPLLGIGLDDWARPWFMHSGSMDNFWLVMAVRYGIPGFALLAAGYALLLGRVVARDLSADPGLARLRLAWAITFAGLTFTLCTVHVWTSIYSFVFFLFGAGAWLGHAAPRTGTPARAGRRPALPYTRFAHRRPDGR